ncbi:MAG TPA: lipoyl synthase [Phycisphaerae bacterium]|nr:lipoyl synthase [Phycisphaerae bacterium]
MTSSATTYAVSSERKPPWLRVRHPRCAQTREVWRLLQELDLNTVCQYAACPNVAECFARGTATFILMGSVCTRRCRFCNVAQASPQPLDPTEGERIAEAARRMKLRYLVLTSVTRDDLPDGGAEHWAAVIRAVRARLAELAVEALIPDLSDLSDVLAAGPSVLAHNIETVPRLYPMVRPQADYERSLNVLARAKRIRPDVVTKSAILVGLGETEDEVLGALVDLRQVGCDRVVLGQYLRPTREHVPVAEFVTPEQFDRFAEQARQMGFSWALAAPLARSSYHAAEAGP